MPQAMNPVRVIEPYLLNGTWVFDEPNLGLKMEPFVDNVPALIERAVADAGIRNAESGFVALFCDAEFPGAQIRLDWVREELDGNVYRWDGVGEGWLCPALLKFFVEPPGRLYVQVKARE